LELPAQIEWLSDNGTRCTALETCQFGDELGFVISQLNGWFEDYNENTPHKDLNMKTPLEFRRFQLN